MRWALTKVAIAVTCMVALAFLIPLILTVRQIALDRAMSTAQTEAAALEPVLTVTTDRTQLTRALATMTAADPVAVRLPDGATLGDAHASDAQTAAVVAHARVATVGVPGGSVLMQPVALGPGSPAVIEVFVDDATSTQGVTRAWVVLTSLAAVLVVGSVLVADRLAARVVAAVRRLSAAAREFGAGDTTVRADAQGPPELREAGMAFNAMADRVVSLLAAERELAADLSHRLRTPLTALRLNAAALGADQAADQTRQAAERLEQEVDAIIRTARGRIASPETSSTAASCDATGVLAERMAFWSALAEDQERPWDLANAEGPVPVPVGAAELGAALDALLGNVFRHTAERTAYQVSLRAASGTATLLVDDAGPGFAATAGASPPGTGNGRVGSTGLGLDIVRRMAERAGGGLRVDRSPLGGAQVLLWLPSGPAEAAPAPRRRRRSAV